LSETDDLERHDDPAAKTDRFDDAGDVADQRLEREDGDAGVDERDHLTPDEIAQRRLEAGESHEWSRDFVDNVDVKRLKVEGVGPDFESTKSYSHAQIREFMSDLPEIQKLRAEGYSAENFQQLGLSDDPAKQRLGRTEQFLYRAERDPEHRPGDGIVVEWKDDHWDVGNGRHRVVVAQELGLETVPAVVMAPEKGRIDDLRYRR
jgi:hypothetical protein